MISLAVACCPAAAATEQRIALIIGNAKYETGGTLANPVNDARLIRSTLERLNFDVVYREDECRIRKRHGPANFATIRHMTLNLLQRTKTAKKKSTRVKRGLAAIDETFLQSVLMAA